jgi:hypothetical protein
MDAAVEQGGSVSEETRSAIWRGLIEALDKAILFDRCCGKPLLPREDGDVRCVRCGWYPAMHDLALAREALRACPEALPTDKRCEVHGEPLRLYCEKCDIAAEALGTRAEALAPSPQKGHALIDLWRQRAKDDMKYGASKARVTGNDLKGAAREYYGTVNAAFAVAECADELEAALSPTTIRAHVLGCPKNFSVPVDLCECGGRDFLPSALRAEALAPPAPTLDDYGELDRRLTLLPRVKHDGLDYVNLAAVLLLTRAKLYSPPRADAPPETKR